MNKSAKNLIVYSLASILIIGVGAPVVQAAPHTREDQKQEEQRRQRPAKPDQTRVAPQRPIVQKPEQPRVDPQRSTVQRQERERTEQHRLNTQRQERERAEQHRLSEQRRDRERAEQNRINTQRQERERAEQHRLSEQRRDRERAEQHRLNEQRRDRENRFRDNNVHAIFTTMTGIVRNTGESPSYATNIDSPGPGTVVVMQTGGSFWTTAGTANSPDCDRIGGEAPDSGIRELNTKT